MCNIRLYAIAENFVKWPLNHAYIQLHIWTSIITKACVKFLIYIFQISKHTFPPAGSQIETSMKISYKYTFYTIYTKRASLEKTLVYVTKDL
jgi:hypothetical protein